MQPINRQMRSILRASVVVVTASCFLGAGVIHAQSKPQSQTQKPPQTPGPKTTPKAATPTVPPAADVPVDYKIGPDDVLGIVFWRDKEMTTDVSVRPDGKITLMMVNDVQAAGLTPLELQKNLIEAYKPFQDTEITVVPRQINSRKVTIEGEVGKQGSIPLPGSGMNIPQLIATAGGFTEYAKKKITILRAGEAPINIDYKEIQEAKKNLAKNLQQLKPGDVIIVK
jgi:polysaccharide biosynthesis/export protein